MEMPSSALAPIERFWLTGSDGLCIACARWESRGPARGVVQIAHGMGEHMGRYADTVDAFIADPLCFKDLHPESLASFLGIAPRLCDPVALRRIRGDLPIYLLSGSEDPIGQQLRGLYTLIGRYRDAGLRDIAFDFYPGGRHEILNETNRREVHTRLLGWISQTLEELHDDHRHASIASELQH